jgi:hypothetical protein
LLGGAAIALAVGCGGDETEAPAPTPTVAIHDLAADLSVPEHYYDFPWPSDLRLSAEGTPDLSGFPNPLELNHVARLVQVAERRSAFPTTAAGHFLMSGPMPPLPGSDLIAAEPSAPVLLVDIDPDSPERGRLFPTVAHTPTPDNYVPDNLLAVASWPGFVLAPNRTYAFVLTTSLLAVDGRPVEADATFAALRDGGTPDAPGGDEARALYEPLWPALETAGVERTTAVGATVFTTGDVVAELADLSDAVRDAHDVTIEGLEVDPDDGADHDRFCELHGTVSFPQFQRGDPPFDDDGWFEIGADGLPIEQRREVAPVVLALPNGEMPAGGYPLVLYFHGSGGLAEQVINRGKVTEVDGPKTKGEGPAFVLAAHGFATAGSAHPVNPERLPGASDIAYLNLDNLSAFPDTFRQGVLEQRLYLDALLDLQLDPSVVASCTGLSLPAGETSYHFDSSRVLASGQSMGGMYTNLIGAVEPRIEAVVPTGAGGFWSFFIMNTSLVNGSIVVPMLMRSADDVTYLHPVLQVLQAAFEPSEPMVFMPRLARRPLPSHPVRPIYQPVGLDDSYFPPVLYDAIALAYGHEQAGEQVWASMQEALALADLDGIVDYPVTNNVESLDGSPYTSAIVQYEGDGLYDPHSIYGQLDAVKHQYGCFFETFWTRGTATVPAPAPLGTPCQ